MTTESVRPNSVKLAREVNRFTQEALAGKCGVSAHTMAMIERGFTIPSRRLAERISQALSNAPLSVLFPQGLSRNGRKARIGWVLTEKGEQALRN